MNIKTIIASVVILCLPLTIGVSVNKYLKYQASQKQMLNELNSSKQELERTNLELKKQIEKLNSDLQAKAEAKEKLAAASFVSPQIKPGVEQWRPLVEQYFPASQVDNALAIMSAESGGNTTALSSTQDRGLFQINQCHRAKVGGNLDALYDPETNVKVAYLIWSSNGSWRPWTTARALGLS